MLKEPKHEPEVSGSAYGIGGLPRKRSTNNYHSMFGKLGNPTRSEFNELTKDIFKRHQ